LLSDTEEEIGKVKWRRVAIRERRIYSLAYVDDIVLAMIRRKE